MPVRRAALIALILLLGWAMPAAIALPPNSPHPGAPTPQQPADGDLHLQLTGISPQVLTPDTEVVITATVRNTAPTPVQLSAVQVGTTYRGLDTREHVAEWATGESAVTATRMVARTEPDAAIEPGGGIEVTLTIEAGDIDPPFDFATLPLLLLAEAGDQVVAEDRSYLLWDSEREYDHRPLRVGLLVAVPLPGDPDLFAADPTVSAQAWRAAAGPDSAAATLVRELAGAPVSLAVDPGLAGFAPPPTTLVPEPEPDPTDPTPEPTPEPTEPTEPTSTADISPASVDATPSPQPHPVESVEPTDPEPEPPADLIAALDQLHAGQLWWLPTGDPDLQALQQLGLDPDATAQLLGQRAGGFDPGPDLPTGRHDVAWPLYADDESPDPHWWAQVWPSITGDAGTDAGSRLRAMVLPASALEHEGHLTAAALRPPLDTGGTGDTEDAEGAGPMPAFLGYDDELSALVLDLDDPDQAAAVQQRLLAETLAIYQEQPAADRSLLIAWPRTETVDAEAVIAVAETLEQTPWATPASATMVLTRQVTSGPPTAQLGPDGRPDTATTTSAPGMLTDDHLQQVAAVRTVLSGAAELVPDGPGAVARWNRVLDQSYAGAWRSEPERWEEPLTAAEAVADEVLSGITVNRTTINFYADEGIIQLTVVNDLPVEVTDLQVHLTPGHHRLRVTEQPEPVTIGPGSRATVQFRAQALSAGQVDVRADLSTPNGTTVGQTEVMEVRVQPTGMWVYWVLGGVAGIILVLGLWRALRPRARQAPRQTQTESASEGSR